MLEFVLVMFYQIVAIFHPWDFRPGVGGLFQLNVISALQSIFRGLQQTPLKPAFLVITFQPFANSVIVIDLIKKSIGFVHTRIMASF